MKRSIHHPILISITLLALILSQLACQIGPLGLGKKPSPTPLEQALSFAPEHTSWVFFTDWDLIKSSASQEELTDRTDAEAWKKYFTSLLQNQSPFSCFGCNFFKFIETWSWDFIDLKWEATAFTADQAPVFILRFRDDFDFTPVLSLFDERGFTLTDYQGAVIYSHKQDRQLDWLRGSELSVINTAFLEDEKVFVLSANIEQVQAALDAHADDADSLAADEAIQATVKRLGTVNAAAIASGADNCMHLSSLGPTAMTPAQLEKIKETLSLDETTLKQLHDFTALAVGYRYDKDQAAGLIVMHFDSADDAKADLDTRRRLAEEGVSWYTREAYSDSIFTVEQASVENSDLVMDIQPYEGRPRLLFMMIDWRDMLFAICPE